MTNDFSSYVTIDAIGVAKGGMVTAAMVDAREIVKPQHLPELYRRFGGGMDTEGIFSSLGRMTPISDSVLIGHEENRGHAQIFVTTGITAAGAGGASKILVSVDNTDGYLRQHDELIMPNYTICQITSAVSSSATLAVTLKPKNATGIIPVIIDGTYLTIIGNNYSDASGADGGTSVGVSKVTFYAQILKEKYEISGRAPIKELWFAVRDKSTGSIIGYHNDGLLRLSYLMSLKADYTFAWGEENTNSAVDYTTGLPSTGTKGMFRITKSRGAQLTAIGTTFSTPNLDTVGKYMTTQGVTSGVLVWMVGIDLFNAIRDGLVAYMATAAGSGAAYINAAKAFNSTGINTEANKEISAVVNYTALQFGNYTHVFKVMENWSDPTMLGSSIYEMTKKGIVFPVSKVADAKTMKALENIAIRYLAKDQYNRQYQITSPDSAGVDKTIYQSLSDKMFTFMCANQSVYLEM